MKKSWLNLSLIIVGIIIVYLSEVFFIKRFSEALTFFGLLFGSAIMSYGIINFSNLQRTPRIIWITILTIIFTIIAMIIGIYYKTGFIM